MTREQWNKAYLAGFLASAEGWNGEYPFSERAAQKDPEWVKARDDVYERQRKQAEP